MHVRSVRLGIGETGKGFNPAMTTRRTATVGAFGAVLWLFVLGFVLFAAHVNRMPDQDASQAAVQADGIVVLTGGPARIAEAARLLQDQRGERLLISGINAQTGRDAIKKLTQLPSGKFECCVDLGYAAQDTFGNATETRNWVALHRYNRLIVVTSRFHMPRSLAELGRALPGVELIPHAVGPATGKIGPWWLSAGTTRVIVSEYVKFLPAAARLIVARALSRFDGSAVAEGTKPALAKTSGL